MRTYELVLVFKTNLTEERRKKLLETVKGWLKGSKVTKEDAWGQKVLAYPIKHEKLGYYHVLSLESEAGLAVDVEKKLIAAEEVLRHLLIRKK